MGRGWDDPDTGSGHDPRQFGIAKDADAERRQKKDEPKDEPKKDDGKKKPK